MHPAARFRFEVEIEFAKSVGSVPICWDALEQRARQPPVGFPKLLLVRVLCRCSRWHRIGHLGVCEARIPSRASFRRRGMILHALGEARRTTSDQKRLALFARLAIASAALRCVELVRPLHSTAQCKNLKLP